MRVMIVQQEKNWVLFHWFGTLSEVLEKYEEVVLLHPTTAVCRANASGRSITDEVWLVFLPWKDKNWWSAVTSSINSNCHCD